MLEIVFIIFSVFDVVTVVLLVLAIIGERRRHRHRVDHLTGIIKRLQKETFIWEKFVSDNAWRYKIPQERIKELLTEIDSLYTKQ